MTGSDRRRRGRWRPRTALAAALLALGLDAGAAPAQEIALVGEPRDSASRVIHRVLDRGEYLLLEQDTVLADDALIAGDVVIAHATVRLEGVIQGAVAVLGGELFIRPGAVVAGPLAVAGGAVYTSGLAEVGPITEVELRTAVTVERGEAGYTVALTHPAPPRRLQPSGLLGFALPTYDRVDGLTVGWGTRFMIGRAEPAAFIHAGLTYATERERLGGSAGVDVPLGHGVWLAATLARATVTNEGWIRGPLANSLAAATVASDARNYHESDAATAGVYVRQTQPLIQGESFFGPRLLIRASRDRSLPAGDPWALSNGGRWRQNPAIDDGEIVSVIAGASFGWRGATAAFDGDVQVEWAPPGIADHQLAQLAADGAWSMRALWNHRIDLHSRVIAALSDGALPRQRWSLVGGPGTLPTLSLGERSGDNLVFVRSTYAIPVPRVSLPLLGPLELRLAHAAGTAWVTGSPLPRWDQNLGAGIAIRPLTATLWIDPAAATLDPVLALSISLGL